MSEQLKKLDEFYFSNSKFDQTQYVYWTLNFEAQWNSNMMKYEVIQGLICSYLWARSNEPQNISVLDTTLSMYFYFINVNTVHQVKHIGKLNSFHLLFRENLRSFTKQAPTFWQSCILSSVVFDKILLYWGNNFHEISMRLPTCEIQTFWNFVQIGLQALNWWLKHSA